MFKDKLFAEYAVSVSDDKQSYGFHTAFGVRPTTSGHGILFILAAENQWVVDSEIL